jgi:hypothetical protein
MGGSSLSWRWAGRPAKTAADHYRERRGRRRKQLAGASAFPAAVALIADRDNLYDCYQELRREGGRAPGIDRVTYDLGNSEAGTILGHLSAKLLDGSYRPRPTRPVPIPKPGAGGVRTLRLGVVCDRVVGKALYRALGPAWEGVFLPCSWGFRPGRGPWHMLATLEARMEAEGCWVVASGDLQNAFDTVPIGEVIECHERMLRALKASRLTKKGKVRAEAEKGRLLRLIETVLRGSDPNRSRGIDQGAPYSPAALNALLHYWLDEPLTAMMEFPPRYFRYADNVGCLAGSVPEGRRVLRQVRRLLRPLGLALKQEGGVLDLARGEEVQLLGFTLRRQGDRLAYGLGKKALDQLRQHLGDAHAAEDPPAAARQSVYGWLSSAGPAFESGNAEVHEVLRLAAEYGFRELATPDELRRHWEESWTRWQDVRKDAHTDTGKGNLPACGSAAATAGSVGDGPEAGVLDVVQHPGSFFLERLKPMATSQLHEFDLRLCRYVLDNIGGYLDRPAFAAFAEEQLTTPVWAFLTALAGDDEPPPPRLLLNDPELYDLAGIFRGESLEFNRPWVPYCPLHRRSINCVSEIRAALATEYAEEWARASAKFTERLEGERVRLSSGIEIVHEWVGEIRRLLGAMGATGLLPCPKGTFPTPTSPQPLPGPRPSACHDQVIPPPATRHEALPELAAVVERLAAVLEKYGRPQPQPAPEALSKKGAAKFIGVNLATIEYLIRTRKLEYVQYGAQRGRLIPVESLRKLLRDHRRVTGEELRRKRKPR